jgi:hypothetical protein
MGGACASEINSQSVEDIFSVLAFKPHIPKEQELVKTYGEGVISNQDGIRYRSYYLTNGGRWLRFRVDLDNHVDKPVTEVMLSTLPLTSERRPPRREVGIINIKGIELGDSVQKARTRFGAPLREYLSDLQRNKQLAVLEYFPATLNLGSCIRFYIKDGVIVAFSFSSEE